MRCLLLLAVVLTAFGLRPAMGELFFADSNETLPEHQRDVLSFDEQGILFINGQPSDGNHTMLELNVDSNATALNFSVCTRGHINHTLVVCYKKPYLSPMSPCKAGFSPVRIRVVQELDVQFQSLEVSDAGFLVRMKSDCVPFALDVKRQGDHYHLESSGKSLRIVEPLLVPLNENDDQIEDEKFISVFETEFRSLQLYLLDEDGADGMVLKVPDMFVMGVPLPPPTSPPTTTTPFATRMSRRTAKLARTVTATPTAPTTDRVAAASGWRFQWWYAVLAIMVALILILIPLCCKFFWRDFRHSSSTEKPPIAVGRMAAHPSAATQPSSVVTAVGATPSEVPTQSRSVATASAAPTHGKDGKGSEDTDVATAILAPITKRAIGEYEGPPPLRRRFHEIVPPHRLLHKSPDDLHRMAMVEEDKELRHNYLHEAIFKAETEIEWAVHDRSKKRRSPSNTENLSMLAKRILAARKRLQAPPAPCMRGDLRVEHLKDMPYQQIYDCALVEETSLEARLFYFEAALPMVRRHFEEWMKNKVAYDPCQVGELVLEYDLAVDQKQKGHFKGSKIRPPSFTKNKSRPSLISADT